jgi:hypothetical protein
LLACGARRDDTGGGLAARVSGQWCAAGFLFFMAGAARWTGLPHRPWRSLITKPYLAFVRGSVRKTV